MAIDLMMVASAGLELLAWGGNGSTLAGELEAKAQSESKTITIRRGLGSNNGFAPEVSGNDPSSGLFIHDGTGNRKDHLAPGGIELQLGDGSRQDGSKWAMFEPFYYHDHFLIEYKDGTFERWDVGSNEGHCKPFQVIVRGNLVFRKSDNAIVPTIPGGGRGSIGNCGDATARAITAPGNPGNENGGENNNGNSSGGGGGGSGVGLAVGGVAVVGIAVYLLSGGTAADVSFAPDYGLHYTEDGGTEYFYGAKWEYQKANWRADWTAMRARKSESWRYASGVEWTAGAWRAAFGGENTGDKTAINLSLAAERRAGGWMLQSAANANARFDEFGGEFAHHFSAAASRRVSEWEVSVSAAARDLDDNPALRADMIFTREF